MAAKNRLTLVFHAHRSTTATERHRFQSTWRHNAHASDEEEEGSHVKDSYRELRQAVRSMEDGGSGSLSGTLSSGTTPRQDETAALFREASVGSGARAAATLRNSQVAAGKLCLYFQKMEATNLQKDSVYGAAIAIMQIARSAGWPSTLAALAVRLKFFALVSLFLQAYLLSMLGTELFVMYPFSGQMHLCDFGRTIATCPDGPNCKGPGGTTYSYPRLYNYATWNTRRFVRDVLQQMFPHRADEIAQTADPGEYGLEDYHCRLVCIFLFMAAVLSDLKSSLSDAMVLVSIPNRDEPWLVYDEQRRARKEEEELMELDLINFNIAGMTILWKCESFIFVIFPKLVIWISLCFSGVHFLMETAGIQDLIINAMALTFILQIDELLYLCCTTTATQYIMENLNGFCRDDVVLEEGLSDEEVLHQYHQNEIGNLVRFIKKVTPWRFMSILTCQFIFMMVYYVENCDKDREGDWVSKSMFTPQSGDSFGLFPRMFGIMPAAHEDPFWTMPDRGN